MDPYTQESRDYAFAIGLLTGTVVGAGAAMWLAPRVVSQFRQRRDGVADAIVRGAQEIERVATAVKSDRV